MPSQQTSIKPIPIDFSLEQIIGYAEEAHALMLKAGTASTPQEAEILRKQSRYCLSMIHFYFDAQESQQAFAQLNLKRGLSPLQAPI